MHTSLNRRAVTFTAASIIAACGQAAHAQDTWVGGGVDNNFSTNANWLDGTAPTVGAAAALTFDTSVAFLAPNVDVAYSGITSMLFDASGAGAYTIGGSSLSFTGGASITNNSTAIQTINSNVVISDTGLTIDAAAGNLVFGGTTLTNGGFDVSVIGASNTTINAAIAGTGGVTQSGAGTFTLGGVNTYTGATTVSLGTLDVTGTLAGDTAVSVTGGTFNVANGGFITGNGAITLTTGNVNISGSVDGTNAITVNGGAFDITASGSLTGNGTLAVNGGTAALNGSITGDTVVTVSGGTFTVGTGGTMTGNGSVLANGGTTNINGDLSGGTAVTVNGGTLTMGSNGSLAGTGAFTLTTGTAAINGTISGSNAITTNGGTFNLNTGGAITSTGAITINTGSTFNVNTGATVNTSGDLNFTGGTFLIDGAVTTTAGTTTIAGTTTGAGSLTINGSTLNITGTYGGASALNVITGTATVTGTINGTGAVTLNGGTFDLNSGGAISGGTSVAINTGATFNVNTGSTVNTSGDLNFAGGTFLLDGSVTTTAGTTTIGGTTTGAGSLNINGSTLNLTGDFGGATALNVTTGTANVTGSISGTNAITTSGGTFNLNSGGTITSSGGITINTGSTFNVNTGSTINTAGDLNFAAGTLLIDGGITTTGGTTTIAGTTTGAGSLTIDGSAATLNITGDFGGSAALNLTDGTYNISGTGAVTTTGNTVMTDGTLTFSGTGDLGGTGNFTINGGTVDLATGTTISTTGTTTLNVGTMTLNGTITGAFNNAGTVTGTGTVSGNYVGATATSDLNAATAGTTGTMAFGADFALNGTANLTVDISKTVGNVITNDQVTVAGDTSFLSNSTITLNDLATGGTWAVGDTLLVVNGTGTTTDSGLVVVDTFDFLNFIVNINGTNLELVAAAAANFTTTAVGANNLAIGGALDTDAPTATGTFLTYLNALNALGGGAPMNTALEHSAPGVVASMANASLELTQHQAKINTDYLGARRKGYPAPSGFASTKGDMRFASAATDPTMLAMAIRDAQPVGSGQRQPSGISASKPKNDWQVYGNFFTLFSDQDTRDGFGGYSADSFGGQFGVDTEINSTLLVGLMVGLSNSQIDFDAGGDADVDTFRIGPYLSWEPEPNLYIDASITYGNHSTDSDRIVSFAGFTGTASSSFDANDVSAYVKVGYEFETSEFDFTPFVTLSYTRYESDAYTETGGGGAALAVGSRDVDSLEGTVGLQVSTVYERTGSATFIPEVYIAWGNEFQDAESIEATFVGGATQFTTNPEDPDSSLFYGVGTSVLINSGMSAFIRYDAETNGDGDVYAISGGVNFRF